MRCCMLILNNLFHVKSMDFYIDRYINEFDDMRTLTNIQKCKKLGNLLLILNILLILVDLIVYKPMRTETLPYLYLFYSHIVVFILILSWLTLLKLHKRYKNLLIGKLLYRAFSIIIIYWGVFMGLNSIYISGQISAYIVCILCISVCLYITPLEAFLTYFVSLVVFTTGLILIDDNTKLLYSHIINSIIVVLISYLVSRLSFISFFKDFISKKDLLISKMELERTNHKLMESEKLRTDFFANISHELKTPLNVIYCAQQMMDITLKQNQYNDRNMNKYLNMVKQNSYRLIRLIGNLIDITKIDALNFEVKLINIDIIKVIEDIFISVAAFAESKGLSFTFDTLVEEKIISCDPDQIERIILNLLSNAVKFTEKGGSIFVYIYLQDNNVCISVKDTGIGIPDNMKHLIFDRFVQVDKSTSKNCEGSGIGLALSKSLAEMHGGSIHVNSKLGEGSEFIIMLPDTIITETSENLSTIEEDCVKKISIEFSDIYD